MNLSGMGSPKGSILSPRISKNTSTRRNSIFLQSVKKSSVRSVSGRSNQSTQIVCRSENYVVEQFGSQLPVLVTEALKFADSSAVASVRISNDGWAWFVCGRRLLIWQASSRQPNSQCRELTLPPSDLAHCARLVAVYTTGGNQMPSCIAVSPEGMIRYWPSIAHESSCVEANADLQGQECDCLKLILPLGVLLATTTASLVLVTPQISSARHALICRSIKTPHGWLGGISQKMSSLIFGSQASQIMETKSVKMVMVSASRDGIWQVVVLAGHSLQKWLMSTKEPERLVYECDIARPIREAFYKFVQEMQNADDVEIVISDMHRIENGVALLVAALVQDSPVKYAIVGVNTEKSTPPSDVSWFSSLPMPADRTLDLCSNNEDVADNSSLRLLMRGHSIFVYSRKNVVAGQVLFSNSMEQPSNIVMTELDTIELQSSNYGSNSAGGASDKIIGGCLCRNLPVFFTQLNGFVSLERSSDDINGSLIGMDSSIVSEALDNEFEDAVMNSSVASTHIFKTNEAESQPLTNNQQTVQSMKKALILYIGKKTAQSKALVYETFPQQKDAPLKVDSFLDTVVVQLSENLIDDKPFQDPRWADAASSSGSASSIQQISNQASLQILNQLEEKQKALNYYLSFLKDLGLWEQLGAITCRGKSMATTFILAEHAEKLVASITLKQLLVQYGEIIESAIKEVLEDHSMKLIGVLTHQDIFFRKVSIVHEVLQKICLWCEKLTHTSRHPQHIAQQILLADQIILQVVQEVVQFRQQRASEFTPNQNVTNVLYEYLPWTAAAGPEGLYTYLALQQKLTLENGVKATGDFNLRTDLLDQLVNLVDIILDGRKCYMESIRLSNKYESLLNQYESDRYSLIKPFEEVNVYDRAYILSEKYCDFAILIELCDKTGDTDRLVKYTEKFSDQGFSQFLFNWFMREGKQRTLIEMSFKIKQLSNLLSTYPSLAWLTQVHDQEYRKVANTLLMLAQQETDLLLRKKSLLSYGKLALLINGSDGDEMEEVNTELELITHQEDLPEEVLTSYGYSYDSVRVFTPSELIRFYVCESNTSKNEMHFKKALDLLSYVEDPADKEVLKNEIWCKAILRDTWSDLDSNAPIDAIQQLLFFRLADICITCDGNIDMMPTYDELINSEEISELSKDSTFQFLLKVGYEHISKTMDEILCD